MGNYGIGTIEQGSSITKKPIVFRAGFTPDNFKIGGKSGLTGKTRKTGAKNSVYLKIRGGLYGDIHGSTCRTSLRIGYKEINGISLIPRGVHRKLMECL